MKGIIKDSFDCSFTNKDGNKVIMSDNLVHIPDCGISLHIRGKEIYPDMLEVEVIPHATKERNMIWFSIDRVF